MGGIAEFGATVAAAGALALSEPAAPARLTGSFPLIELRQYTLHDGQRDVLIDLFEREFIESQEAVGMKVIGTFTDLDRPNRFVWLRGFRDMNSRAAGLNAFYGGPIWKAHREAANATMVDSDNVLLLRAPNSGAEFGSPQPGPPGLYVATIHYLKTSPAEAAALFERQVKPKLESAGVQPLAWFVPETAANNFPRLPVRQGERLLVWFARFDSEAHHSAKMAAIKEATAELAPLLDRPPEVLRLKPTARSELGQGTGPSQSGLHDFDFLQGRWIVKHRRLKARGIGSQDWIELAGSAVNQPLLDGICNVEEHHFADGSMSGIALRCFDRAKKIWSIYWVNGKEGMLQPPVFGSFKDGVGRFEGEDTDGGRPIIARFLWHRITPVSARWEQSFSYDGGKSWETNWIMDFERGQPR